MPPDTSAKKTIPYYGRNPVRLEDTGLAVRQKRQPFEPNPKLNLPPRKNAPLVNTQLKRVPPTGWGTSSGQPEITAAKPILPSQGEIQARQAQAQDIAARTNQAQHDRWNMAMRQKEDFGGAMGRGRPSDMLGQPPLPRDVPPAGNDPYYAIQGLQGNVLQRMGEQGARAAGLKGSFQKGGTVPETGNYLVHQGEEIQRPPGQVQVGGFDNPTPQTRQSKPTAPDFPSLVDPITGEWPGTYDAAGNPATRSGYPQLPQEPQSAPFSIPSPQFMSDTPHGESPAHYKLIGDVWHPELKHRPNPDVQGSFQKGGTVPRTGAYKLHRGEKVIPSRMAQRFGESCK